MILDTSGILSFQSNDPLNDFVQRTFNGLSVSFERPFTPTIAAVAICHLDKEPSRFHAEVFDRLDLGERLLWCNRCFGSANEAGQAFELICCHRAYLSNVYQGAIARRT